MTDGFGRVRSTRVRSTRVRSMGSAGCLSWRSGRVVASAQVRGDHCQTSSVKMLRQAR